ncbi:hypothetical protein Tco_0564892 [Tanacetum coccineum]
MSRTSTRRAAPLRRQPQPRRIATTIIIIILLSSSSPPPPRDHPLHFITATHTTITAPRHPPPRPPPKVTPPDTSFRHDTNFGGVTLFLEELLSNDFLSLPETESSYFDHYDVPSSPRPPAKPPDDGIFFDFEPDTSDLTAKVVEDIYEHYVLMPKLLPTQPTLCPNIDTLLPFSSKNEDKVFNPGILSSPLLSHQGKFTSDFSESPMMSSGGNIPVLDILFEYYIFS